MADPFNLRRFVTAQDPVLPQVQAELRGGRKRSHWMWFVFPQLAGLGRSETARFYALVSLAEAQAYLAHPVLGPRLVACTGLVNAVTGRTAHEIFGSPDDTKFHSCITLFMRAGGDEVFWVALATFFSGQPDRATEQLLAGP